MLDCNISINNTNEIHINGIINFGNADSIMELGCHYISKISEVNINLQNLRHSDSSGLAVILAWVRFTLKSNKKINIYHMPKFLSDLSNVSNLEQILPIAINS